MNKSSKIYVAGHTGLLGSALMKKLQEKGYVNIVFRTHKELELKDSVSVDSFFHAEQPEIVFLAAGMTGSLNYCNKYPASLFYENSMIQNNVFIAAQQSKVDNLVFFGSTCSYPKHVEQPINENSLMHGPLEELTEAYGAAKLGGILACKAYNTQYNNVSKFIAIVPNTIYGPNSHFITERSHVFSALIAKFHEAVTEGLNQVILWGSGKPRREFIFSEDIAEASIFLLDNADKLENVHYNVGSGVDITIQKLASMIAQMTGFVGEIKWDKTKPDGQFQKLLDINRIKQLGWVPSIPIEEGLRRTHRWYLKNLDKLR